MGKGGFRTREVDGPFLWGLPVPAALGGLRLPQRHVLRLAEGLVLSLPKERRGCRGRIGQDNRINRRYWEAVAASTIKQLNN